MHLKIQLSIHFFSVSLASSEIDYGLFKRKAGAPSFIKKKKLDESDYGVRMDKWTSEWMDLPLRRKRKIGSLLFLESRLDG